MLRLNFRLLILIAFLGVSKIAWAADLPGAAVNINLEGSPLAAGAYVDANNRTMVPLRFVAEALGFHVDWLSDSYQVNVQGYSRKISLWIDNKKALVDGQEQVLDTVPSIKGDRCMVPLRFVAETMGLQVNWDGETRTVFLARQSGAEERPDWVEVTGSIVNIREGPGTGFAIVEQVRKGTQLLTLASSQGWYKVQLSNGVGWIAGGLTRGTLPPQQEENEEENTEENTNIERTAVVIADGTALYAEASSKSSVVGHVNCYSKLEILGQKDSWYKVANGAQQGWIADSEVAVKISGSNYKYEEVAVSTKAAPENIVAVDTNTSSNELVIKVRTTGKVSFTTGKLTESNVLFVDLSPATLDAGLPKSDKALTAGPATRLSFDQFEGNKVRLTLNLRQRNAAWKQFAFDPGTGILTLVVGLVDLRGYTIVLDPGHGTIQDWGGWDPGAIGNSGLKERDVVLPVAKETARLLAARGATVILASSNQATSLGLSPRTDLAKAVGADIFVSIHANSSTSSTLAGTTTYYCVPPELSSQSAARASLASSLQKSLLAGLGLKDLGVRQANYVVLKTSSMPSALVELAFLSNAAEEKLLGDPAFQNKAAQSVAEGITNFLLGQSK